MIEVTYTRPVVDPDTSGVTYEVVAVLTVDGFHSEIDGPQPGWVDFDIPILMENGGQLLRSDDPEKWARCLPEAYRGGDVQLTVVEVEAPELVRGKPRRH